MVYRVLFYCPDEHLRYDLRTLDHEGVGGGVTARVRMAHALASAGHEVTLAVNCLEDGMLDGVDYVHHRTVKRIETDILIASTSGALDLTPLCDIDIHAQLRLLMVHGVEAPAGLSCLLPDYLYALSNFIRGLIVTEWGFDRRKLFVSHRGVQSAFYRKPEAECINDPYALAYSGHPSKGLAVAVRLTRLLRSKDSRYTLHIFGGAQLWGESPTSEFEESGVMDHGLVGQRTLAGQMERCGFSINLQTRQEPFGMVILEGMRAGCIVLASPVGAYPEQIKHGENGFLIEGDPREEDTIQRAADLIQELSADVDKRSMIRERAITGPLDWSVIASAWAGHWDWILSGRSTSALEPASTSCTNCRGGLLQLEDGKHCVSCGLFFRRLAS
jgi:glycosyltransferase involved in cell wall biosynthesis